MAEKTFRARVGHDGPGTQIRLPFDPKAVFGAARAPVRATVNGHAYRTTTAIYGGVGYIGFPAAFRKTAGIVPGETIEIALASDTAPRVVRPPADLAAALKRDARAAAAWKALSFTHRKEWALAIRDAKKPETRARRVAQALVALRAKAPPR